MDTIKKGDAIIAAGAGTGISAKFIEKGGADLIIIYNSGRFRMMGHGSTCGMMAYGDANAIAMEIGEYEVLPVVEEVPVICGVHATDPRRRLPPPPPVAFPIARERSVRLPHRPGRVHRPRPAPVHGTTRRPVPPPRPAGPALEPVPEIDTRKTARRSAALPRRQSAPGTRDRPHPDAWFPA